MKRKLLIAACALFGAMTASAQVYIETDLTSQFNSLATTKWTMSSGQVTWAAPQVKTNSGLTVAAWERYDGTCNWTGDIMYTTVTGLVPGTYKIELYGAAAFTFDRGFGSTAFTGDFSKDKSDTYTENQSITENTGVTLYATTSEGTVSQEIPIYYATNFNTSGIATATLNDVVVGSNGQIKIGLSKNSTSTNWHVVQLKGVTATVDAVATFATFKAQAEALYSSPMSATALSELQAAANADLSSAGADEYKAAIETLEAKISAANTSIANYAEAKTILEAANSYDESGKASYAANATIAAIQEAYNAGTLISVTSEQKAAANEALVAALKAQTTEGSDWTGLIINPSFESDFSDGWTNNGMARQNNNSFAKAGTYYAEAWQPNGTKSISQTITSLPAGVYSITAHAKARGVTSAKIFAAGINQAITIADSDADYTVEFACDNNADVTFGFEGEGTGAGNSWLCVDNFRMSLVSAGLPDVTAVTGKMNAGVAQAQDDAIAAYNANRTVANYNAASAAIAAAQTSVNAYASALSAIETANALKEAHNFASSAATTTFAEAIAAIQTGYNEGTITNEEASAALATLGFTVTGWHAGNDSPAAVYMRNGFSLGNFDKALYINTWSTEGANDGSNFVVPFYEYWTGDANGLNNNTWTGTLNDMPNGLYTISAWVRVRAKNGTTATDATGITMDVNGGGEGDYAAVDVTEGTQIGTSQFTIGTFTAQGLVNRGKLTLNFNIADANISWLSIKNIKYTKVRDLNPDEELIIATDEDYAALNLAISNAESKTLGFEEGEYAPYNNTAAIALIAAAKAINQNVENVQEDVQAATTALNAATWTANTEELNAFYDGDFSECAEDNQSPLDYTPAGWTASENFRMMLKNTETYPGLLDASIPSAVFTWSGGTTYGEQAGYEMPLKANTIYTIKFKAAGWENQTRSGMTVSILNGEDGMAAYNLGTPDRDIKGNEYNTAGMTSYECVFATGAAGNYVFHIQSGNNMVLTDFEIKKAASQELTIDGTAAMPKYAPGTYPTVIVSRPISAAYNTLVVPFAITEEEVADMFGEGAEVYVVSEYESGKENIKIAAQDGIEANKPVILKATTAGTSYEFTNKTLEAAAAEPKTEGAGVQMVGTYAAYIDVPMNDNAFIISGDYMYNVDSEVIIRNTRAYIQITDEIEAKPRLSFSIVGDEATGIDAVEGGNAADNGAIYNLSGQRVGKDYKGIVIKNGKKVMMR